MPRAYIPRPTAVAHGNGERGYDLVVEPGQPAAVLGHELRVEGREPVARHLELDPASVGQHRLAAVAVAAVRPPVGLAAFEVMIDLGVERALGSQRSCAPPAAVSASLGLR